VRLLVLLIALIALAPPARAFGQQARLRAPAPDFNFPGRWSAAPLSTMPSSIRQKAGHWPIRQAPNLLRC
jgi:hypothetical protein